MFSSALSASTKWSVRVYDCSKMESKNSYSKIWDYIIVVDTSSVLGTCIADYFADLSFNETEWRIHMRRHWYWLQSEIYVNGLRECVFTLKWMRQCEWNNWKSSERERVAKRTIDLKRLASTRIHLPTFHSMLLNKRQSSMYILFEWINEVFALIFTAEVLGPCSPSSQLNADSDAH